MVYEKQAAYPRYLVTHGFTYVHLCRTHEMWADAMTKVSDKNIFFPMRRIFYGYAQSRNDSGTAPVDKYEHAVREQPAREVRDV